MADKQIKIALVVDERSADQAKRALTQLVNVAKELGKALGGGPGGGGGGGLLGGLNVAGGGPGGSALKIGAPGGQSAFAMMAKENQKALSNMKGATVDTMKSMADSVRRAIEDERKQIEKLKLENQALNSEYAKRAKMMDQLAQKGGKWAHTLGAGREELSGLGGKIAGNQHGAAEAADRIEDLTKSLDKLTQAMNPTSSGGIREFLTKERTMPGANALAQSPWAKQMGLSGSGLGRAGLAAAGVMGLKRIADEVEKNPMRFQNYRAQLGNISGQMINPLLQGDGRDGSSFRDIMSDPGMREDYQGLNGGGRRFLKGAKTFGKGLFTLDFHQMGMGLSGRAADLEVAQEQQQMRNDNRAADPLGEAARGNFFSGHRGRMGQMRSLGWGAGKRDQGSGLLMLTRLQQQFPNFDLGEIIGAKQGVESTGTRAASNSLFGSALQAQAAGIQGAAGMAGTASKFGIGTGGNFLKALRGMPGDVMTASTIGNFASGMMDNLGIQGLNGLGMMGAVSMGTGHSANGRLIAEQNIRGAGALNNVFTGQTDPYQKARNIQIAMGAAPGAGIYGQDYLANKMGFGQMADVMAGGSMSPIAKSLGLNKGMVGDMFKGKTSSLYERMISDPMAMDTPMGQQMQSMMDSGMDPQSWFKKNRKKAKNKGKFDEDSTANYAAALMMSNPEMDEATAMGMARDIFGMGTKASTSGKQRGDVAGGSMEAKQAAEEVKILGEQAKILTGDFQKLSAEVEIMAFKLAKMREVSGGDKDQAGRDLAMEAMNNMGRFKGTAQERYDAAYAELLKAKAPKAKKTAQPRLYTPGKI